MHQVITSQGPPLQSPPALRLEKQTRRAETEHFPRLLLCSPASFNALDRVPVTCRVALHVCRGVEGRLRLEWARRTCMSVLCAMRISVRSTEECDKARHHPFVPGVPGVCPLEKGPAGSRRYGRPSALHLMGSTCETSARHMQAMGGANRQVGARSQFAIRFGAAAGHKVPYPFTCLSVCPHRVRLVYS